MIPRRLLTDLEAVACAARAAGVTRITQQSIDYAVCQLQAEVETSRPAPGSNAELREEITMRFRKAREILAGIK